jgi:Zn-dependent protease
MSQGVAVTLFQVVVLVLAFSVHESAHAYVAMKLGDPTAYMLGRVSLNPMRHIDPLGSVLVPLISLVYGGWLIGWAKPCPVTVRNFRHVKRDDILTSLAGPASNLAMAVGALALLVLFKHLVVGGPESIQTAMEIANRIPGVDTSTLPFLFPLALFLYLAVVTNLLLFVFNLIPIPPLDGSHVVRQFLPYQLERAYDLIGRFGLILIFVFGGRYVLPLFYFPLLNVFYGVLQAL